MDGLMALGQEYKKREKAFQSFAHAFVTWANDHCPSFGEGSISETEVQFQYVGRRLLIRHTFEVEGHLEVLTQVSPETLAEGVCSRLELFEVTHSLREPLRLATSCGLDWVGRTTRIAPTPDAVFQGLVKEWLKGLEF